MSSKLTYDLHIHSCLSPCGDDEMTPANIAGMGAVLGLEVMAVTDHNTCRNCPSFAAACDRFGIRAIFGMELTTLEEVHVLCYLPDLKSALEWGEMVYSRLPSLANVPAFFGNQIVYDENDRISGEENIMLAQATTIPFGEVDRLIRKFGGVMVPAHINKESNSLIRNLGFIPEDSTFRSVEIQIDDDIFSLKHSFPYLGQCRMFRNSDAHTLEAINEPVNIICPENESYSAILSYIGNGFVEF